MNRRVKNDWPNNNCSIHIAEGDRELNMQGKENKTEHACDTSTWEIEAGGS